MHVKELTRILEHTYSHTHKHSLQFSGVTGEADSLFYLSLSHTHTHTRTHTHTCTHTHTHPHTGATGEADSLFTPGDRMHAKELTRILKEAGQVVPPLLAKYAPQSTKFADSDDEEE